jgi:hypothetical protein
MVLWYSGSSFGSTLLSEPQDLPIQSVVTIQLRHTINTQSHCGRCHTQHILYITTYCEFIGCSNDLLASGFYVSSTPLHIQPISHGAHTTLQLLNTGAQCNVALLRDRPGWSGVGCLHRHQQAEWRAILCISFSEVSYCLLFSNTRGGKCWIQTNLFIEGVGSGSSNLGSVRKDCPSATGGSLLGPPGLNIEMSPCIYRTATPLRGA